MDLRKRSRYPDISHLLEVVLVLEVESLTLTRQRRLCEDENRDNSVGSLSTNTVDYLKCYNSDHTGSSRIQKTTKPRTKQVGPTT